MTSPERVIEGYGPLRSERRTVRLRFNDDTDWIDAEELSTLGYGTATLGIRFDGETKARAILKLGRAGLLELAKACEEAAAALHEAGQ